MKIESSNNPYILKDIEKNTLAASKKVQEDGKQQQQNTPVDKLEISPEAKKLMDKNVSGKDFEVIKQRIQSNFYNSPEVLASVATSILKEIENS
ncbi:MAG: hypothetical protein HYV28_19720 [Ignavibacteriales bacterium]|nr:hypothetical protein [Ignavibacteriales bacterium]